MRLSVLATLAAFFPALGQAAPIPVVAAENFYGDVVQQVGGDAVTVTSILSNPDQDPHLFEASASTARAVAGARLVVFNGAAYDPWMQKLLGASKAAGRVEVDAASLTGHKAGDNPHLWYDPDTMRKVAHATADALTAALSAGDRSQAGAIAARVAAFDASLQPLDARLAQMRQRLAGVTVTATEPVFGYMAAALGLTMRNERFQLAVMNDTEPRASDVAAFEADLKAHRVRALIYNSQATGPVAKRMLRLAAQQHVTAVPVTETEPAGVTYQAWMAAQLDALDAALQP